MIGTFAKLAVERIDSVRLAAGEGLVEIAQVEERKVSSTIKGKVLLVDTISEYVLGLITFAYEADEI